MAFVVCQVVCTNKLVQTNKKFFTIESNCDYFFPYGRKLVYSEWEKCSNHLARCEVTKCSVDVWKYHTSQHCKE